MKLKTLRLSDIKHSQLKERVCDWENFNVRDDLRIYYYIGKTKLYFSFVEHLYLDDMAGAMRTDDDNYPYIWDDMQSFCHHQGDGVIDKDGVTWISVTQNEPDLIELQRLILCLRTIELSFIKKK